LQFVFVWNIVLYAHENVMRNSTKTLLSGLRILGYIRKIQGAEK